MIIDKVLEASECFTADRTIADVVIGVSLLAVELDNGAVGVSYVLRDSLPSGCSIFSYAQDLVGKPAAEIAAWAVSGREDLKRGLGMATLNAASGSQTLHDEDDAGLTFGIKAGPAETVGMIGHIPPIVKAFRSMAREIIVFDEGLIAAAGRGGQDGSGNRHGHGGHAGSGGTAPATGAQAVQDRHGGPEHHTVYPASEQARLLPSCDIVIMSGTTIVNGTIDSLLGMCGQAREIVLVGASTPMFPAALAGTPVTVLAGSWWDAAGKVEIFRRISLAGGIAHVQPWMIKKAVRIG